jgi:hypothetical protein
VGDPFGLVLKSAMTNGGCLASCASPFAYSFASLIPRSASLALLQFWWVALFLPTPEGVRGGKEK